MMNETLFNIVPSTDPVGPTAALHTEVIADLVCPFCYIGKRRLERALEAVQGPSEVSWRISIRYCSTCATRAKRLELNFASTGSGMCPIP